MVGVRLLTDNFGGPAGVRNLEKRGESWKTLD